MCEVYDKPDAALDEALDDVERKLNVDFNRLAARDELFPALVGMLSHSLGLLPYGNEAFDLKAQSLLKRAQALL